MNGNPSLHLWLIPLLPFVGFLLNGLLGRFLGKALVSTIALLFTAAPLGLVLGIAFRFSGLSLPYVERLPFPWMETSAFRADFAFLLDPLTLVMLLVVTGVGFLIHIYSVGYMAHEDGYWRYFAYLNLFMFFMLTLVLAENFLLLFVGWEGVGLASYLLVGFYYLRQSAADAGKKAFILNRVGDFGFLLAMFLLIAHFGSLSFHQVFSTITANPQMQAGFLTAICLLLVLGATGKSAQIPLYVWLPDAMEGPTPVSALIHAATMVTAGVYMVVRSHVLFDRSPFALGVVAVIGAATALFAATSAWCRQISSACWPTPPSRSSATCSWLAELLLTRRPSSTWSRTPSSRACSSCAPEPSCMPWAANRTCASWAACANPCPSLSGP